MNMISPDSYTRGGIVIDDGPHRLGPSGDSVGGDLDLSDAVEAASPNPSTLPRTC